MIEVVYDKKKINLPEKMEELTAKQFIAVSNWLFKGGNALTAAVDVLRILCGKSKWRFRFLPADMIDRCLPLVEWVFDDVSVTRQLIPVYKNLYGPTDEFNNLRMAEFHYSELYYREIVIDGNYIAIDQLIAVLYRPAKKGYDRKLNTDGDIRIAFNDNLLTYYANKIAKWPDGVKYAIFLWYHSCRQKIIADNSSVFEGNEDFESAFDTGLYGMMRTLAGEKLGTVAAIEQLYVHTALLEIGLIKEEEKRIKAEIEAQKK